MKLHIVSWQMFSMWVTKEWKQALCCVSQKTISFFCLDETQWAIFCGNCRYYVRFYISTKVCFSVWVRKHLQSVEHNLCESNKYQPKSTLASECAGKFGYSDSTSLFSTDKCLLLSAKCMNPNCAVLYLHIYFKASLILDLDFVNVNDQLQPFFPTESMLF